jgi:hypothetical protein
MRKVRQYIAHIYAYNNKLASHVSTSAWEQWSSNCAPNVEIQTRLIKEFIKEGVYGKKVKQYAAEGGCCIYIYEAKELALFEGKIK